MNREVHVRFWEHAEVKSLRATRQTATSAFANCSFFAGSLIKLEMTFDALIVTYSIITSSHADEPPAQNATNAVVKDVSRWGAASRGLPYR
jgi:hypothetical protein